MKKLRVNLRRSSELLDNIVKDYRVFNVYIASGNLLSFLNSTASFSSKDVHSFLSSVNQYKDNSENPTIVKEIFILILNSRFINEALERTVKQYCFNTTSTEDLLIMIQFFLNCLDLLPNHSPKRISLLYPCVLYISHLQAENVLDVACEALKSVLEDIKMKQEDEQNTVVIVSQAKDIEANVEENEDISLFPEYCDIFPSIIYETPQSLTYDKEDYLQTQFSLLKNEYIKTLREVVNIIKEKFSRKSSLSLEEYQVNIYEDVIIEDLYPSSNDLVHRVYFDIRKFSKNFNWKKSSRFPHGSLLCFTNNFFETFYFGFVEEDNFNSLSKGVLMVQFNEDPLQEVIRSNNFVMLETKIMYDVYHDFLLRFQLLSVETLPFIEYFAMKEKVFKCPMFLNEGDLVNLRLFLDVEMDSSQEEAFSNAMQYNLSLIKGSTCTGKTFLCLKMVKYILSNYKQKEVEPILVIYNSDDALDDFIFDSFKTIDINNIVKVGGSNRSNLLRQCDISTVKWDWIRKKEFPNYIFVRSGKNKRKINQLEETLCRKYVEILNCTRRLLSLADAADFMLPRHAQYFKEIDFNDWITNNDAISSYSLGRYTGSTHRALKDIMISVTEDTLLKLLFEIGFDALEELDKRDNDTLAPFKSPNMLKRDANIKLIIHRFNVEPLKEEEYNQVESLDVDFNVRIRLYRYWLEKYRGVLLGEYKRDKKIYEKLKKERDELLFDEYVLIMRSVRVIVITLSSAVKYGEVLERVQPRIIIVEEAGEISESRIICSLTQTCQQLILLGSDDDVMDICPKDCKQDSFLFHKLIRSDFKCVTLQRQYQKISPGRCNHKLECGHICTWLSHKNLNLHSEYKCEMPCLKTCKRSLHQCLRLCYEECQCRKTIEVGLECGHIKRISCYKEESQECCVEECENILMCGHKCMKVCGKTCECLKKMCIRLKCGHDLEYYCGEIINNVRCMNVCKRKLSCGHIYKGKCYEVCVCVENVEYTLSCHHKKELRCGTDSSRYKCLISMGEVLPCGHISTYTCCEGIPKCNKTKVIILPCGHRGEVKCKDGIKNVLCTEICLKNLGCNHTCKNICHAGDCLPCQRCLQELCEESDRKSRRQSQQRKDECLIL